MSETPRSLCPDFEINVGLTDSEFWEKVACSLLGQPWPPVEPEYDFDMETLQGMSGEFNPCVECGAMGPCGFDANGRPMIHVIEEGHEG